MWSQCCKVRRLERMQGRCDVTVFKKDTYHQRVWFGEDAMASLWYFLFLFNLQDLVFKRNGIICQNNDWLIFFTWRKQRWQALLHKPVFWCIARQGTDTSCRLFLSGCTAKFAAQTWTLCLSTGCSSICLLTQKVFFWLLRFLNFLNKQLSCYEYLWRKSFSPTSTVCIVLHVTIHATVCSPTTHRFTDISWLAWFYPWSHSCTSCRDNRYCNWGRTDVVERCDLSH